MQAPSVRQLHREAEILCLELSSPSVAESCQEGILVRSSLLFQLILGSVLVSIWETGMEVIPHLVR